jgi:antitoxin component of MazEF toxin-antitoxin module
MLRKVFKTENSLVVSLPKDMLELLGVQDGMDVFVELDRKNRQILIRPTQLLSVGDLSEEFVRQVNEFIEEYRPVLEALSHQ